MRDEIRRAALLREARSYPDALRLLNSLDPQDPEVQTELARAYAASGDFTAARQSAARAVALAPSEANSHFIMAQVSYDQGDLQTAEKAALMTLSLAPNIAIAHWFYAKLLFKNYENAEAAGSADSALIDQATHEAEIALSLDPQNPDFALLLAAIRLVAEDQQKATSILQDILAQDPNHQGARRLLRSLSLSEDHPTQSINELANLLAEDPADMSVRARLNLSLRSSLMERVTPWWYMVYFGFALSVLHLSYFSRDLSDLDAFLRVAAVVLTVAGALYYSAPFAFMYYRLAPPVRRLIRPMLRTDGLTHLVILYLIVSGLTLGLVAVPATALDSPLPPWLPLLVVGILSRQLSNSFLRQLKPSIQSDISYATTGAAPDTQSPTYIAESSAPVVLPPERLTALSRDLPVCITHGEEAPDMARVRLSPVVRPWVFALSLLAGLFLLFIPPLVLAGMIYRKPVQSVEIRVCSQCTTSSQLRTFGLLAFSLFLVALTSALAWPWTLPVGLLLFGPFIACVFLFHRSNTGVITLDEQGNVELLEPDDLWRKHFAQHQTSPAA